MDDSPNGWKLLARIASSEKMVKTRAHIRDIGKSFEKITLSIMSDCKRALASDR